MGEVTYYPEVRCEVQQVVPPFDRIAEVRDVDGHLHQLTVPNGTTRRRGTADYLSIAIVEMDRAERRALIEFPVESGRGTNRAWVDVDELYHDMGSRNGGTSIAIGPDETGDFTDTPEAGRTGPSAEVLVELAGRFPPPQEWWDEDFEGL
jgi:hypothetical protein